MFNPWAEKKGGCCNNNQKKLIKALIKATKLDLFIGVLDSVLKPLPKHMQSIASTIFISVIPIFFIYGINLAFAGNQDAKD